MESPPRVEDDDDSSFVWEGIGPANRASPPERLRIQRFLQRLARDVQEHEEDYGPLRDPLILLAENYARTCQTDEELERRLDRDASAPDTRGAAAVLLRKVWQAQQAADGRRPATR